MRGLFFYQVENKILTLLPESGSAPVYDVPMCIVYRGHFEKMIYPHALIHHLRRSPAWMKIGFKQAIRIPITVILTNTTFLLFWTPKIKVNPDDIVYGNSFNVVMFNNISKCFTCHANLTFIQIKFVKKKVRFNSPGRLFQL